MNRRAFLISMAAVAVPTWPSPCRAEAPVQEQAQPIPAEWDFTAEDFEAFQARTRAQTLRDEVA